MFSKLFGDRRKAFANMGWRYVSYTEKGKSILFRIEPMIGRPDIVYVPNEHIWNDSAPSWVNGRRTEIVEFLKSISWNRKIKWEDCDVNVIEKNADDDFALPGSLESTPGGREFEKEKLFEPGSLVKPEEAHALWCRLEKRFAEQANGVVRLLVNDIVPNSVFEVISLPALKENPNVRLEFIS